MRSSNEIDEIEQNKFNIHKIKMDVRKGRKKNKVNNITKQNSLNYKCKKNKESEQIKEKDTD